MHILWTALLGLASGFVAKLIFPGKENMGLIVTCLLGIAGSFVASYGGLWLKIYQPGESAGFIGSVVGALVILFIYGLIRRRKA
ncbi:MAG: GlsB/YeaQ/YmgE family stress response membrane protein [Candidatus Aminicenantales bacterium]